MPDMIGILWRFVEHCGQGLRDFSRVSLVFCDACNRQKLAKKEKERRDEEQDSGKGKRKR